MTFIGLINCHARWGIVAFFGLISDLFAQLSWGPCQRPKAGGSSYLRGLMVFVFQLFSGRVGCFESVWTEGVLKGELEARSKYNSIIIIIIQRARLGGQSNVIGLAETREL